MLFLGVCGGNLLDWNYYLVSHDGELFYEGYKYAKLSKSGEIWQTTYTLPSKSDQKFTMNITENNVKYPTGQFWGHLTDLNG